jgi:hypothetical protein
VNRLGEFLPIGRFLTLGNLKKLMKPPKLLGHFFPR